MRPIPLRSLPAGLIAAGALLAPAAAQLESPSAEPEAAAPECEARLDQFEPRSAAKESLLGRDAVIFYEALLHKNRAVKQPTFDRIVIRSGPDVFGGSVVLIARGDCVLGHGFVSGLELLHATEVLKLYRTQSLLAEDAHLDLGRLRPLAEAGDPAAQLHVGLTLALGWGPPQDRATGIDWLRRAAVQRYPPGMLALGMALAGPGVLEDEVITVGQPPRTDEFTDRVQACVWLSSAAGSNDRRVVALAQREWDYRDLATLMTREQRAECKRQLRSRD